MLHPSSPQENPHSFLISNFSCELLFLLEAATEIRFGLGGDDGGRDLGPLAASTQDWWIFVGNFPWVFVQMPRFFFQHAPKRVANDGFRLPGDEHSDPSFSLLGREWRQLFGRCFHFKNGQAGCDRRGGVGGEMQSSSYLLFARLMRLTRLLRMARHGISLYGVTVLTDAGPLCWLDKGRCLDRTNT